MTATIEAIATRHPRDLAAAVVLLLDNREIEPLHILWRLASGDVFVGPLPPDLRAYCDPIGTVTFWQTLVQYEPPERIRS